MYVTYAVMRKDSFDLQPQHVEPVCPARPSEPLLVMAVLKSNDKKKTASAPAEQDSGGSRFGMRWDAINTMDCSVARTLSVVGERWTMLIMREAFLGRRRFDEFQHGTRVARNILSSRLRDLVQHGILERTKVEREPRRVEY